ncbi:MAG TPA: RNA 2',3'-cyclic phosphodiesterase [Bryobacteraceae bacterium]|jgi:2'-5' RNA ligase
MRLFTAIDIPTEITSRLTALVDRLRSLAKLSWSPTEHLHVTTKFIGEWPETRLIEVERALSSVPCPGPIEIAVRGLGWFPNHRDPRVFWAGVESGPGLRKLAQETEKSLAAIGVPVEERDYHPHLTLARRRVPVPLDRLRQELARIPSQDFGCFRAESFFLYLSKAGKYSKLNEFPIVSKL